MGRLGIILFFSLFRISDDPVLSIIRSDAMKIGIPETYLNEAFSHSKIEIHDSILDRFARPYEKKSWDEYRKLFVTKNRIDEGAKFFKSHGDILTWISKELKVDPFLILSIIGVESNFGRHRGKFTVFNALYTQISKMPRRSKWAQKELVAYLSYCYTDNIPPHSIVGSYAGAFGYGQFIPTSFKNYAIDGNGDGIRQPFVWADVFASIANYLVKNGYPVHDQSDAKKVYKSVYAYNHADNYVKAILELREELNKKIIID